ncbi:MAG: hypothetical protein HC908_13345 [Calothrix sp. SM1_7_51]|nr:hypothetical protein [Calothrix sp. SM1_7_51]
MKIQTTSIGIITSLILLGENFLPVQAQKAAVNPPSYSLVSAISQTIRKEHGSSGWEEIKNDITFKYIELDLNKDGTKETLVSIQQGVICNNRHCPVYIYQKTGNTYRYISRVFASRVDFALAVLPSNSKGWININVRCVSNSNSNSSCQSKLSVYCNNGREAACP